MPPTPTPNNSKQITLAEVAIESWPLRAAFRISRTTKSTAEVITVTLKAGDHTGRGEGCPYPRYGENPAAARAALKSTDLTANVAPDQTVPAADLFAERRHWLLDQMPAGSARNALDCALWDLEAKWSGVPVWQRAALPAPRPQATCFTLSLDTPEAMAANARAHDHCSLLKLKLGAAAADPDRMRAVRQARPDARLVADANEGWAVAELPTLLCAARDNHLEMIEQPLPADQDRALHDLAPAWEAAGILLCADESAAPGAALAPLADRYHAVNIKLDKTGGFTAAIDAIHKARAAGLKIMIGSMVSTSLAMAPAALLGGLADWIDLDSPLLLAKDRANGLRIEGGQLSAPSPALWG